MTGINVMLNTKDVSEYLKISPNGLEVDIQRYHNVSSLHIEVAYNLSCHFRRDATRIPLKVYGVRFKWMKGYGITKR